MYLKALEIVGFKSFAEKTRLEFEPGMTAIVGPNGCGKSNVSDAVRWALGEQSAKALRGAKMEDVIFNGTDSHKPLGMAEVSLTLADCEQALGTEYHEVTVTRRVFRSGEGQYFINRAPCRLKDIQRLFMDTGIGTNSYSLMEQGKIDRILSSHPEDRRAVFEEASGITKFKADKREALRKLEQTEANLLRLDDIIREVKRQIISMQRQAGKAKRYQELQTQLRAIDLFATRERLDLMETQIKALEARLASITEQDDAARTDIDQVEAETAQRRHALEQVELSIAGAMEAAMSARTELERVREAIRHSEERRQELQQLSERDTRDADEARQRRAQHEQTLNDQQVRLTRAQADRDLAERELTEHAQRLTDAEKRVEEIGRMLHTLRTEQVELDSRAAQRQNELAQLDAEERANMLRRERLAAEHAETTRALEIFEGRQQDMGSRLGDLRGTVESTRDHLARLEEQKHDKANAATALQKTLGALKSQAAARQAQIELLEASGQQHEGFALGARQLLNANDGLQVDRARVLGPLAEQIQIDPHWQHALEAALRPWLDAVVVDGDAAALAILRAMDEQSAGAIRLLSTSARPAFPPPAGHARLLDHVRAPDALRPALECILGHVCIAERAADIPDDRPAGLAWVTASGLLVNPNGTAELWRREEAGSNPLTRQQLLNGWREELARLQADIRQQEAALAGLAGESNDLDQALRAARQMLEEHRRLLNTAEGENQVIAQEAKQARERAETVAWELQNIEAQHKSGDDRRTGIQNGLESVRSRQAEVRATLSAKTEELRDAEQHRNRCAAEATDRRVRFAETRQAVQSLTDSCAQLGARVQELTGLIDERSRGISTYQARLADLETTRAGAAARVEPLEADATRHGAVLEQQKALRDESSRALAQLEAALREKRTRIEEIRGRKSSCEVELAQQRVRRQNQVERVTGDYRITMDEVLGAPEPTWENSERPDREALEIQVAELRAKLEAMGPVNLVAIEEHRELEERYQFLTQQQTDLTNSKDQLMEMIREINKTTTEMFADTFAKVNANFQEMFTKLFGGGSAKLVLVDEGDVLESGIEIIARPPGKKLQTVSLLSGGERTMTAVALLFSLYLVKPSPFCLLDELDAALDDANIGRFVKTVTGFLERSQFIVITHNRQTIAAARMLYGVTMEKQGVSKIVSVKFSEHESREDRHPPQPTDTPARTPADA
ncbi:MAG TPA: chromosome segregation protein SMC [Kiritimatiellia bacterium]|nr:chromosome segregation protein SMC [Kiritimatiellia bacterium]